MKFSIGQRMFAAILCAATAVAAIGGELLRWSLFDNFSARTEAFDWTPLDGLASAVRARYRSAQGWSFLPSDEAARKHWLADFWREQPGAQAPASSPALEYRVGLVDADGRYLAGALANPLVIAFASVDTMHKTLVVDGTAVGYLVVAKPQHADDALTIAFLIDRQQRLFVLALIGLFATALVAAALTAHLRAPILRLLGGARRLAQGDFAARLHLRRRDEFGELGAAFDHLAARLEHVDQERRQWVSDTSHELRTPLSVLQAQLEALQDGVRHATPENIALLLKQTRFLAHLVNDLNELAHSDAGRLEITRSRCDAWQLVEHVLAVFAERFRAASLVVTLGPHPSHSMIDADPERLRQVLTNLFENCARHTDPPGRVAVSGTAANNTLRIDVDDSAPSVPSAQRARLGERFFRVDASRDRRSGGAGLGLALSRQIVLAHGGRLEFAESPLGGLRATIVLPLLAV